MPLRVCIILIALLASAWQTRAQPSPRISLLTGVGAYPANSGWRPTGAGNDLPLLRTALEQHGFQVEIRLDTAATKQGIVQALKEQAQLLVPGSVFHFHFSGHGQQVADRNGDEFDGLDEALVPYDAPKLFIPGQYEGAQHLIDDELDVLLTAIRRRLGSEGQVFVSLDACHSGTATRGQPAARGTHQALVPPNWSAPSALLPEPSQVPDADRALAPLLVFTASSPRQLNWELLAPDGKHYGPLSYALTQALLTLPEGLVTYRSLFDRVRARMAVLAPRQTPSAEGELEQRLWRGGSVAAGQAHFTVSLVGNQKEVQLRGGLLQSLRPGAQLAFYPPGTQHWQAQSPFARGQVVHSDLVYAYAELDAPAPVEELAKAWVFVTKAAAGTQLLTLQLDLAQDTPLQQALQQQLANLAFVEEAGSPASLLIGLGEDGALELWRQDEQLLCRLPRSQSRFSDAAYLTEHIRQYAQAHHLRQLEHHDDWLQARLYLIPMSEPGDTSLAMYRLAEGTRFYIDIENTGLQPCYFQLLNIQADDKIVALFPGEATRLSNQDLYLEPGERKRLRAGPQADYWVAEGPPGIDVLKLILTDEPVDLQPLLRGQATPQHPEGVWSRWLQLPARRGGSVLLPSGSAGIATTMLEVYRARIK